MKDFSEKYPSQEKYIEYFNTIQDKIEKSEKLSLEEQIEWCSCLTPEYIDQYAFCDDEKFKTLFLDHFQNKTTGELFTDEDRLKLESYIEEWNTTVSHSNHTSKLLNIVTKETRDEKKILTKTTGLTEGEEYENKVKEILYYSKYVYILTQRIFGLKNIECQIVELNGNAIHIDYYSIVHILNRHFSPLQKQYENDKDFFTEDVIYDELIDFLESIIRTVDEHGGYIDSPPQKIMINYKGNPYTIYINKVTKQKKGIGNYECLRLKTFFPVGAEDELKHLETEMTLVDISENLGVYLEKDH